MNTKKLDKLRDIVYRILVIHLNIRELEEVKLIIKNMVNTIDDERIFRNLIYTKYVLNMNDYPEKKIVIDEYKNYNLCLMLLILKATKKSKYKRYKLIELVNVFCSDYSAKEELEWIATDLIDRDTFDDVDYFLNPIIFEDDD
jgi:hypothetical protein